MATKQSEQGPMHRQLASNSLGTLRLVAPYYTGLVVVFILGLIAGNRVFDGDFPAMNEVIEGLAATIVISGPILIGLVVVLNAALLTRQDNIN